MKTKRPSDITSTVGRTPRDVASKPKLHPKEKASPNTIPTDHFEKAESPEASVRPGRPELQIQRAKSRRQPATPQGSTQASIPTLPLDLRNAIEGIPEAEGAALA